MEERVHLSGGSRLPAVWVEVEFDGHRTSLPYPASGRERSGEEVARHTLMLPGRGRYDLAAATVRVRDPFGLFHRTLPAPAPIPVTVYPRPVAVPGILSVRRHATAGGRQWLPSGADVSLGDLRPYVPGDAPRRIHWPTTARRGAVMVVDPEPERRRAHWLLADLGGGAAVAERTAGAAAYLAEALWQAGEEVGLIAAGKDLVPVPARRGRDHLGSLLEALALTPAADRPQILPLLRAAAGCQVGMLVLLTPAPHEVTPDIVRRLRAISPGARVVAVPGAEAP